MAIGIRRLSWAVVAVVAVAASPPARAELLSSTYIYYGAVTEIERGGDGSQFLAVSEALFGAEPRAYIAAVDDTFSTILADYELAGGVITAMALSDDAVYVAGHTEAHLAVPESFVVGDDTCSGVALAPGETCSVAVSFTPGRPCWRSSSSPSRRGRTKAPSSSR